MTRCVFFGSAVAAEAFVAAIDAHFGYPREETGRDARTGRARTFVTDTYAVPEQSPTDDAEWAVNVRVVDIGELTAAGILEPGQVSQRNWTPRER